MGVMWRGLAAGAVLLTACDSGISLPGLQGGAREIESLLATPAAAVAKAPTPRALLQSCSHPEPDFPRLRAALAEGSYDEIDAVYDALRDAYAQETACESYLWMATRNLADEDFALLDRFVAARPDSWGALTARGARWVDSGYARRGNQRADAVSDEQWAGMRDAFAHADRDLSRALSIEPADYVAWGYSIYRLKSEGDADAIAARLDAFVARDPLNVGVRKRAIEALSPKWGGSLDAMRARAEEAQAYADRSPRLRLLPGLAIAVLADLAHDRKEYGKAVELYQRAIAYGDERDWYNGMCDNLDHASNWPALESTARHWIEAGGDDAAARFYLGKALMETGQATAAVEQLDRAHALWPNNAEYLRWRGHARRESGDVAGAVADWRLALELVPGDAWTLEQLRGLETPRAPVASTPAPVQPATAQGARPLPGLSRLGATPNS